MVVHLWRESYSWFTMNLWMCQLVGAGEGPCRLWLQYIQMRRLLQRLTRLRQCKEFKKLQSKLSCAKMWEQVLKWYWMEPLFHWEREGTIANIRERCIARGGVLDSHNHNLLSQLLMPVHWFQGGGNKDNRFSLSIPHRRLLVSV